MDDCIRKASALRACGCLLAGLTLSGLGVLPAKAASYRMIYSFLGMPDAANPSNGSSSLVADGSGRLLGATSGGGTSDVGAIYRLTKPAFPGGTWTEEILHSFNFVDGQFPSTPLVLDGAENVYGMTSLGGISNQGVVFRLDNLPFWPIATLHNFGPSPDGGYPNIGGLSFGPDGLLYGTTSLGGLKKQSFKLGYGTAFSISPLGDAIEYTIIHDFGKGGDGFFPLSIVLSHTGRLFGVTSEGGVDGQGVAFSLQRNASGAWKESQIAQFAAPGVHEPALPPFLGKASLGHDLYGCGPGGANGLGVVYRLSPPPDGSTGWTQTILYNFGDKPGDPSVPQAGYTCGIIQGDGGKLYGTTGVGGANNDGAFFEVDQPALGATVWTESVLYSFNAIGNRGYNPIGIPLRQGGKFYGIVATTSSGFGGVYELTP